MAESDQTGAPIEVEVPPCYSEELKVDRNSARQLLHPSGRGCIDTSVAPPSLTMDDGTVARLLPGPGSLVANERALHVGRVGLADPVQVFADKRARWFGNLARTPLSEIERSWDGCFHFSLEDQAAGKPGLRLPQIGAIHAILGHWTTGSEQPATVVMPTGTGKTDAMVGMLAASKFDHLLIVVPSDTLRTQIADKFESFGVLQKSGVIERSAIRPVVGQLKHALATAESATTFVECCNVVVTTPQALLAAAENVIHAILDNSSHLFVDEAHHVEAPTWRLLRSAFKGKPVVQFTATPFREDGRRLAGRLVYVFPLREAQRQRYFSRIRYRGVQDLAHPDKAIATAAIGQLRDDLGQGLDHLIMARVKRIGRADEVRQIYANLAPDLHPVVLYSRLPARDRRAAIDAITARTSRIIVCVDMLGEGFDLPALKIAAIHDIHKSLGVTLQFIGRFARTAGLEIGEASVVVGRPRGRFDEVLRRLYAEDPDWNLLIRDLAEEAISDQREVSEFEAAFGAICEDISLRNIEPKMSTVVYRTRCRSWQPEAIYDLYRDDELYTDPIPVNPQYHVAWFVTRITTPISWGRLDTIADTRHDLYVLYWNEQSQLLFINSSNNDSVHEKLAQAVCGDETERITGENVYRVMANVNRLVPTNLGLLDIRNYARRFSMHVGADVIEGFPIAEAQTKTKTNISAYGFENGSRVSISGSLKGRVWSHRIAASVKHWMDWCDHVGAKVADDTISVESVMRGFIRPEVVETRPALVPLALEWPWEFYACTSEETVLAQGDNEWPLLDVDLLVTEHADSGPIRLAASTPDWSVPYEITIANGRMTFRCATANEPEVVTTRTRMPLTEYFQKHVPMILFEKDAVITAPCLLLRPDRDLEPFDDSKLIVIDWENIDIQKESQGPERDLATVQARAIAYVRTLANWDLLIDDDGSGEVADVVGILIDGDRLVVRLVHCKYSSEDKPGARVEDLYEVCGQAQKSIRWRRSVDAMFGALVRHEKQRLERGAPSGFLAGDQAALFRIEDQARLLRPDISVTIVQPGISKQRISTQQRDLLASTETYLHETAFAPFGVVCSE